MNKNIKAFLWNAGGMVLVGISSYVLNIGNIRLIDPVELLNISVLVIAGLILNRVTKILNKG